MLFNIVPLSDSCSILTWHNVNDTDNTNNENGGNDVAYAKVLIFTLVSLCNISYSYIIGVLFVQ